MLDINFEGNPTLWGLINFSTKNNIDIYSLLHTAIIKEALFTEEMELLSNFIESLRDKSKKIKSQLLQDAFASFIVSDLFDKTFLEFGATDGMSLSNSYMLENELGWTGILAEPSPQWHKKLKYNRPNTQIITECIWKSSGEKLDFFVSDVGVLSTLVDFKYSDLSSMPGNTKIRTKDGKVVKVETISINEVMETNFNGNSPSYVSIDTEGSEYEILNSLDFEKYRPVVFTIEHNFTNLQNKIDALMISKGYTRVFRELTSFDGWYVLNDAIPTKNE
ncbi:FkbM family methyltransferase [Candidatus Pseudothioglobus singularis]|jgi:FkbM family methyltransferase|nr:FkbM family methyltransferase [Candidatus Pseudothioglobus singularis]